MADRVGDPTDLASIVDTLREGLQVIDAGWRYRYVNAAAARHGQRPAEELLGRTMAECYPGIEHTEMFGFLRECMAGGGPRELTNRFVYPNGRTGWFQLRMQKVALGVAILSLDITEQRLLERKLEQSQRLEALGRLAGGVAHDFNNLLTIVVCHAGFLAEELPSDSLAAEDVQAILGATGRGASLTRQLLAFARSQRTEPAAVDPIEVTDAVLALIQRLLGDSIRLVRAVDGRLPPVLIDRGRSSRCS